jgi:hypothetical protein
MLDWCYEMTDALKFWLEYALKILAAAVAIFGVWKYFLDRAQEIDRDALLRSLSYVEAYGSGELLGARENLFDFWIAHQEDVAVLLGEGVSRRSYSNFLNSAFEEAEDSVDLYQAVYQVTYLFDQVHFCRSSGLCREEILEAYFCPIATRFISTYSPIIERNRSSSGIETFGAGLEAFATACSV